MKRIFHTWDKWECYPAGFYENKAPGLSNADAVESCRAFLADIPTFAAALERVLTEWPNSCEHYLSNVNMNRIAWLGQAAMCIAKGVPSCFRGGYNLLSDSEKALADETALAALNQWLLAHGEASLTLPDAQSRTVMDLY